jgi:hypothetical protein
VVDWASRWPGGEPTSGDLWNNGFQSDWEWKQKNSWNKSGGSSKVKEQLEQIGW